MAGEAKEYLVVSEDSVIRCRIKTFKEAINIAKSLDWLPGQVLVCMVICDAKEI